MWTHSRVQSIDVGSFWSCTSVCSACRLDATRVHTPPPKNKNSTNKVLTNCCSRAENCKFTAAESVHLFGGHVSIVYLNFLHVSSVAGDRSYQTRWAATAVDFIVENITYLPDMVRARRGRRKGSACALLGAAEKGVLPGPPASGSREKRPSPARRNGGTAWSTSTRTPAPAAS